jgi:endonuclease/exonuclease/phosphatase (EEP) superfamily protein YafD
MKFQFKPYLAKRITILTILMVLAAAAGQLAQLHWALDLATHLTWHYILAGITFSGILFWLDRPRWALLAMAIAILHTPFIISYAWIEAPDISTTGQEEELRVLQFNIGSRNQLVEKFYSWLQARPVPPEIVVIIEASDRLQPVVEKISANGWPRALADYQEDNYGIAVLSRIKDSTLTLEQIGDPFLPSIIVQGQTDEHKIPFSILATHPPPPITGALSEARNRQYAAYAEWARNEATANRIIVGDLNATPWSYQYQQLLKTSGMRDSQSGHGYSGTFPAWLPAFLGIPIDHTLVSESIDVLDRKTGPGFTLGSDHRVVETTLKLAK